MTNHTAPTKLTAADVRALPKDSVYYLQSYPSGVRVVVSKERHKNINGEEFDPSSGLSDRATYILHYCPDPAWVPPSQRQPAPPAAAALDGWRAKCGIEVYEDETFVKIACGGSRWYLDRHSVWVRGEDRIPEVDRIKSRAEALSALALADPPPNCMDPDAVAERAGVDAAKHDIGPCHNWGNNQAAFTRGYNRQLKKMEATRVIVSDKPLTDEQRAEIKAALAKEQPRIEQPAKPDELAAEREAMVQRAERHCYTLPAGGYVQWNWKSHADFAISELAAASGKLPKETKEVGALEGLHREYVLNGGKVVSGLLMQVLFEYEQRIAELEAKPAQTEMLYVPVYPAGILGQTLNQKAYELNRTNIGISEWLCWPATVVKGGTK